VLSSIAGQELRVYQQQLADSASRCDEASQRNIALELVGVSKQVTFDIFGVSVGLKPSILSRSWLWKHL
jgi:predicted secreted protein